MKKLILFFALVFSTFAFAQNKEFTRTYERLFVLKGGEFNHYQIPTTVTYNYKDSNYIVVTNYNKSSLLKVISKEGTIKEENGSKWIEFEVQSEDGKSMMFGVFEEIDLGCMVTDGETTLGFNNIKNK